MRNDILNNTERRAVSLRQSNFVVRSQLACYTQLGTLATATSGL